jgi:hypothetical protein
MLEGSGGGRGRANAATTRRPGKGCWKGMEFLSLTSNSLLVVLHQDARQPRTTNSHMACPSDEQRRAVDALHGHDPGSMHNPRQACCVLCLVLQNHNHPSTPDHPQLTEFPLIFQSLGRSWPCVTKRSLVSLRYRTSAP